MGCGGGLLKIFCHRAHRLSTGFMRAFQIVNQATNYGFKVTINRGSIYMKVTVITSSPRKRGTTSVLVEEFIRGAKEAGHDIFRFDAAFEKLAPCMACNFCRTNNAQCAQKDSMEKLNPELLGADCIVFITPLYYFGMSAQLKLTMDRFYANSPALKGNGKKTMLLAAAHDDEDWAIQPLADHYKTIVRYMNWDDRGILLATGCGSRSDIEKTDFPARAFKMGKDLT